MNTVSLINSADFALCAMTVWNTALVIAGQHVKNEINQVIPNWSNKKFPSSKVPACEIAAHLNRLFLLSGLLFGPHGTHIRSWEHSLTTER